VKLILNGVIITEPAAVLTAAIVSTDETCINANDGTVTITANGGTAPYSTSLDGVTYNTGQLVYNNLADGNYTVYVRDANNCIITPLTFTVAPGVDIQAAVVVDPTCTANVPGNTVTVNVNAAVAASVQYSVDGITYQASNTFTNLAPGTYTAYVQHTNGCIDTEGFVINNLAPVNANAVVTSNVLCFGEATGVITVNATGGTGTIEYAISPAFAYGTNNVFSNLPAGSYEIRVRDAIGCELILNGVIITEPAAVLTAAIVSTDETCINANDGTVTITANGGTAPYSTSLDGVTYNTGQLVYNNLADGNYTVYVRDANNCIITPLTFTVAPGVDIQAAVVVDPTCTANVPGNTVTVNVNAAVAASVQYSVDGITYQASNTFTNLAPGTYTAYVQHTNGCIDTEGFVINNLAPVNANAVVTSNVLCFGEATGVITVNATGGTGTIEYAISPAFAYGTNNVFSNLPAGSYTIMVRDAIGCEVTLNGVIITEPAAVLTASVLPTNEICFGANDGTVTITANGGTAPYSTSLDGVTYNAGQLVYNNLADGNYTVYVRDANNCTITPLTFTVAPGVNLQILLDNDTTCINNSPGNVVTANVTATLAPFVQYSLDGVNYSSTNTWTNLAPGNYTAYVQHANGCVDSESFVIVNHQPVQATAVVTSHTTCFGTNVGQIVVNGTGGTGTLNYAISPNFNYTTSNIFSNLAGGTYTIRVMDYIGCVYEIPAVVVNGPTTPLVATISGTHETCLGNNDGSLTVVVSGGTPPYSTSLNTSNPNFFQQNVFTYNNLTGGDLHLVYVRDANGCQIGPLFHDVEEGVELKPTVEVELNCIDNTPGNVVTFTVDAELEPETQYSLDGVNYQDSNIFTDLAPGNYHAYVLHENGCLVELWFTVAGRAPIIADAVKTDASCNGAADGSVTVTATGGNR
jgi:predicted RNase H-like HicB family nuclease